MYKEVGLNVEIKSLPARQCHLLQRLL